MVSAPPALLLAGHGTRSPDGVAEFHTLVRRVRALAAARRPGPAVGGGFIELSPPPISATVADLVAAGHRDLAVVPLVLFDAGHAKTDVPASVNLARAAHPGVRVRYGRALGVHPDLVELVDARLRSAVPEGLRRDTAVLLVGRGSTDPDANAELHRVARLLWEGREWPLVEPAYVSLTGPRVPEGLARLHALGARRVAVVPYLLFAGVLERRIGAQARSFAAAHPGTGIVVTRRLGPDTRVAALALARYDEALAGTVARACDTCVHRVALPGFAHKVGAALRPHHHPDDAHTHDAPEVHPP